MEPRVSRDSSAPEPALLALEKEARLDPALEGHHHLALGQLELLGMAAREAPGIVEPHVLLPVPAIGPSELLGFARHGHCRHVVPTRPLLLGRVALPDPGDEPRSTACGGGLQGAARSRGRGLRRSHVPCERHGPAARGHCLTLRHEARPCHCRGAARAGQACSQGQGPDGRRSRPHGVVCEALKLSHSEPRARSLVQRPCAALRCSESAGQALDVASTQRKPGGSSGGRSRSCKRPRLHSPVGRHGGVASSQKEKG
mmetsp:Transcript_6119/g.13541  ORF Transcript_6119/g.13541 Transcript_6119/m.13541 type:complete len:257 (+) Transcript_6119:648-1418(+)